MAEITTTTPCRRTGLSATEAATRLQAYGRNEVRVGRRTPLPARVLIQLRDPLILVLLAAAVLTTWTGDLKDTVVIAIVVTAKRSELHRRCARTERSRHYESWQHRTPG